MDAVQNQSNIRLQHQIRNQAEEVKNTLNDLFSWEKKMKDKELKLRNEKDSNSECFNPIRSNVSTKDIEISAVENEAELMPEQTKQNNVDLADVYKELGNKYVKLGEYDKAVIEYTAAISKFDKNPKLYTNRALCYLKLKRYDDCIRDCNQAIEIDSLTVKAYYRRMQANENLGNNADAVKDCSTVLLIDSKNVDAKKSLQRINQKLKISGVHMKASVSQCHTISKEGPNFSPLRSNLVDILPINKPIISRSKKPLKKMSVIDVIGPKDSKNFENSNIQISDEVIEKLFNGECGSYEEVKKPNCVVEKVETDVLEMDNRDSSNNIFLQPQRFTESPELNSITKNKALPESPKSTAQFYCNWKELEPEMKYQYLKSIPLSQLNKILGAGFDSETLSDLLKILKEFYIPNKEDICGVLLRISKHDGLSILSLLLSADDKAALTDMLRHITEKNYNIDHVNSIRKSFNLH